MNNDQYPPTGQGKGQGVYPAPPSPPHKHINEAQQFLYQQDPHYQLPSMPSDLGDYTQAPPGQQQQRDRAKEQ